VTRFYGNDFAERINIGQELFKGARAQKIGLKGLILKFDFD